MMSPVHANNKKGKAVGAHNVAMEALIFGSVKLYVHISLLFSLCVRYGHAPDSFNTIFHGSTG